MDYKGINIKWLGHDGFFLTNGKIICIDPYHIRNVDEKCDILLITHTHPDHASIEDMKKVFKSGGKVVGPSALLSMTRQLGSVDFTIMEVGKKIEIDRIKIEAVPAYNINKSFHPKDEGWIGYIIEMNGIRIYHAGDTDLIPEMKNIKCDIALLPISGKFTMTAEEAAKAAEIIHPDLAIPMHWGDFIGSSEDAERFVVLCREKGINAEVLEKEM